MVDADQRLARRPREPLRRLHADEQRAHEARAVRHRDAVDVVAASRPPAPSAARTTGPTLRRWSRDASSGTTPPYGAWSAHLRVHDVGQHAPVVVDDRRARLVARRLDA